MADYILKRVKFPILQGDVNVVDPTTGKATQAFLDYLNDLARTEENTLNALVVTNNDLVSTIQALGIIIKSQEENKIEIEKQKKQAGLKDSYTDPAASQIITSTNPDTNNNVQISVAAHSRVYSYSPPVRVSVNAGQVQGLAVGAMNYAVYYDDIDQKGGAVTYYASTDANNALQVDGRHFIGYFQTPTKNQDGTTTPGGGSGGGVGGGGYCISDDAFLHSGVRGWEVVPGDELLVLSDNNSFYTESKVENVARAERECVTLTTVSGITLTVSVETPITLKNNLTVMASKSLGYPVAVLDQGRFRWEPIIDIKEVGMKPVTMVMANDQTYAAGDRYGRFIFSHNKTVAPRTQSYE